MQFLSTDLFQLILVYGDLADGHELYIKFLCSMQEEKEMDSEYLQRLYIQVMEAAEKGGLPRTDIASSLLRQFVSGCRDEQMVQKLRLDEQFDNPPKFGDLLLQVRKEGTRRNERSHRFGTRVAQSFQIAVCDTELPVSGLEAEVKQLQDKIACLEKKGLGGALSGVILYWISFVQLGVLGH